MIKYAEMIFVTANNYFVDIKLTIDVCWYYIIFTCTN